MESMELRRSWVEEQHYVHDSVFLANKLENCDRRIKFEFPNMALQAISDNLCIISGGDEVTSDIEVSNKNSSAQQLVPYVSTNVTTDLEVPNNNSSGMQLVPHVVIDVPSSIEVPNNNSLGLQLVEHMANNVASSIEVANNNSDPQIMAVPVLVAASVLFPHLISIATCLSLFPTWLLRLRSSLRFTTTTAPGSSICCADDIAVADCATSITAIMFHPPSSGDPVYLVAVGIVFTAGMLAVLATLWVARDSRKRRTAKKKIMYASVAPFILGLVLNVYAYKVKK